MIKTYSLFPRVEHIFYETKYRRFDMKLISDFCTTVIVKEIQTYPKGIDYF